MNTSVWYFYNTRANSELQYTNRTPADDAIDRGLPPCEYNCQHFIPVTAIVLHTHQFNQWLEDGHQFAQTVCRIAVLLHGTDEDKLVPETINEELNKADRESILNQGINKVTISCWCRSVQDKRTK